MILVLAAAAVMSANGRRVTNVDLEGSLSRNLVVDHGTKRIEHEHARNRRIETLHSTRGYDLSALQAMGDDELVEKLHEHERNGRVETLRSAHGYNLSALQATSDDDLVGKLEPFRTLGADLLQRRELEPFSTLGEFPKDRSSHCHAVCSKTYEADIALQESGMLQPKYPVLGFQALRKKWTRDNMHASAHARAIPVVGVALIRDEVGMVLRTLYSIDVPVEHIVIIVGPGEASAHAVVLNHIKLFIANVTLVLWNKNAYPSPSETWNAATRAFPRAAWILHVAPDTTFMPGSLAVLSERMFAASASELSIIAYARYTVPFGAIFNASQ